MIYAGSDNIHLNVVVVCTCCGLSLIRNSWKCRLENIFTIAATVTIHINNSTVKNEFLTCHISFRFLV